MYVGADFFRLLLLDTKPYTKKPRHHQAQLHHQQVVPGRARLASTAPGSAS